MKTKTTLFLLLAFFAAQSQPQNWQWAKRVGTVNDNNSSNPFNVTYDEMITDVKADKQGNVYAVGYFYPNPTFVNVTNGLPATGGYGERDAYLIKYNSCGNVLWWRRMGGASADDATSLVLDNNGKVIVTGYCATTFTLGGNNVNDTVITWGGNSFLARFDTAGHFVDIHTVPMFQNKIFITSQGDYFLSNYSGTQAVRINTLGAIIATYTYAVGQYAGFSLTLDKNDNVYLSGAFYGTISIGQGTVLTPATPTVLPNMYWTNSLIMKFSSTGTLLWYNRSYNTVAGGDAVGYSAIDTSGNILVVGGRAQSGSVVFGYTITTGGLTSAIPIFWFDANTGNPLSVMTGTTFNSSDVSPCYTDHENNIYFKGLTYGSVTFNATTYSATVGSGGGSQSFIGKLSATNSSFISINMLPQLGSQRDGISGLDVNEQGNVYIGGMFGGTLDSASTAVNIVGGAEDGFVAKYGFACNSSSTSLSPLPPTSLAAQYQATLTNYVTWIDNAQYENSYELWYNTNSNPTFSLLATLPANTTSYTHTSLAYNTTYCYKARAVNNIGASFFTNVGCATTPTNGGGTGTAPNAPLNLTAINNGSLTNNVAWNDNSNNEDNFELHYTIGSAANYSLLATLPANTTSYTHTGLSYTTTYCYKVAATNSAGSSAFSNTACATTPANGTGIAENEITNQKVIVYPNPAKSEIYFDIPSTEKQIDIEIYNTLGSLVLSKKNYSNRSAISISKLSKGLYYYKVILPKSEFAGKVILD